MSSTLPKSIQAAISDSRHNPALNQPISEEGDLAKALMNPKEYVQRISKLSDDFLRLPELASSITHVTSSHSGHSSSDQRINQDMLEISVVEATLIKNYGLLRMDLYCKIRIGHLVCETPTCPNGAKNPRWSDAYHFNLKPGIDSFHIEIYDEKQFTTDEKIAWLHETIPPEVFQGITVERWFPLSGRLGPNKEGSILLVMSMKQVPIQRNIHPSNATVIDNMIRHHPEVMFAPVAPNTSTRMLLSGMPVDPNTNVPIYVQPEQAPASQTSDVEQQQTGRQSPQNRQITDADIDQLSEMFPAVDKAMIKAVLENNRGDKEASITFLLTLG